MSVPGLEQQLRVLAASVDSLTAEVQRQGRILDRVLALLDFEGLDFEKVEFPEPANEQPAASSSGSPPAPPLDPSGLGSSPSGSGLGFSPDPRTGLRTSPSRAAAARETLSVTPVRALSASISDEERSTIAREIGHFFSRALSGAHRGPSGRSQNPLASRVYVVCRGADGTVFDPPRLYHTLGAARTVCEDRGQLRDSVFCGFPSLWEAKLACQTAGLRPPTEVR